MLDRPSIEFVTQPLRLDRDMTFRRTLLILCLILASSLMAQADDAAMSVPRAATSDKEVRSAVEQGMLLLTRSARGYPSHRKCFACHHQTLPLLAYRAAKEAGVTVDPDLPQEIGDFTDRYFRSRIELMKDGNGIPGRGFMVAYGALTLRLVSELNSNQTTSADRSKDDELAVAFTRYLLKTQKDDGRWSPASIRPPLEESDVTGTMLARGHLRLAQRPQGGQQPSVAEIEAALQKADQWLIAVKLTSQEDLVFRVWGLAQDKAATDAVQSVLDQLLQRQREEGGWGQLPDMPSDAYATGQAIFVLREAGLSRDNARLRRGVEFLMQTRQADGSWLVKSRSKPIQEFFDNGDPHGKDQFISISATAWAVTALAKCLPPETPPKPE